MSVPAQPQRIGPSHPFERWPEEPRTRRIAGTAVNLASLGLLATLAVLDGPLQDASGAATGTIDFEFAGTVDRAAEILSAWEAAGEIGRAGLTLGIDFLFPILYAAAIAAGCIAAAGSLRRRGRQRLASLGPLMAWTAFAAAGFDYVENIALAAILLASPDPSTPWPQLAFGAAAAKFALLVPAVIYALAGGLTARSRGVDPDPADIDRAEAEQVAEAGARNGHP